MFFMNFQPGQSFYLKGTFHLRTLFSVGPDFFDNHFCLFSPKTKTTKKESTEQKKIIVLKLSRFFPQRLGE